MSLHRPIVINESASGLLATAALGIGVYLSGDSLSLSLRIASAAMVFGVALMSWILWLHGEPQKHFTRGRPLNSNSFNPFGPIIDEAQFEIDRCKREICESESQLNVVRVRMLTQKRSLDRQTCALKNVDSPVLLADKSFEYSVSTESSTTNSKRDSLYEESCKESSSLRKVIP